jgi:hypothetical protein
MQLRASLGRAARPAVASRRAGAPGPPVRASGNGAATSLADVDTYHQAWISAVDAAVSAAPAAAPTAAPSPDGAETFVSSSRDAYFTRRHELVLRHFPQALGIDDFMSRVEIALSAHGFRGDNSIGGLFWAEGAVRARRVRACVIPRLGTAGTALDSEGPRLHN